MAKKIDPQLQTMIDNMPEKTGRSLDSWFGIIHARGLEKHGEIMKLLKGEFDVSHGFANTITLMYREKMEGGPPEAGDLVSSQYEGKQDLKPVYETIIAEIKKFGNDIEIAPKKSYVSLRRAKQFAIIQPSTKSRVDLGLNLKGEKGQGMLIEGDKWSGMCTHRIELHGLEDVDDEVLGWLRAAYEMAN